VKLGYNVLPLGKMGWHYESYGSFGVSRHRRFLIIRGPSVLPSELQAKPCSRYGRIDCQTTHRMVNSGNIRFHAKWKNANFMPGAVVK